MHGSFHLAALSVRMTSSLAKKKKAGEGACTTKTMDWNSRRLTAVIENALLEDRASRDASSYACIEANLRAAGTIIAKQDCVLAASGCVARILDTRKTVPGLRMIDKYAVRCGGGQIHRLDLSDGVLIKHNHIALAGGVVPALERAHHNRRGSQPIEVEVRTLAELEQALEHGAEAVLLDNMSVADVKQAVARCSQMDRRIPVECSGGVNLENVRAYAETGVQFISVGALTHSAVAMDMSLRVALV